MIQITAYSGPNSPVGDGPGTDNILSMTCYTGTTAKTYYYLTDHLGSVHALADESGNIVESYNYDAWGRVLGVYDSNGNQIEKSTVGNRYLWQGREYSFATGLYYFRSRFYDPVTGRFLSNDPIGINGGMNQYAFVEDNPVNFTDPSGLRVVVADHPAVFGSDPFRHAAIVLIPDNPADFANNPLFSAQGGIGISATLGGQPGGSWYQSWSVFGNLQSDPNYSGDCPKKLWNATAVDRPERMTDTEFINALIQNAASYKNNRPYFPFPAGPFYNSNSYVSGVITAAGATPPALSGSHPGYSHPLPLGLPRVR